MTKVKLELLMDYDMHLFVEKGLRGGISMSSRRYARANNPLVPGFNPNKTHIAYLDANNLYGWAMSQPLPTGGFKWVAPKNEKEIMNLSPTANTGYILEVDFEFPEESHDAHNAYPLASEKMATEKEWLSEYQQNLLGSTNWTKIRKLVSNLRNKEKYVLHYRNLQLYLSFGMKLTKVHRVLSFRQSPWMEPYIRMNTELRKKATNNFEKDLFKLMNNSVFGKRMDNLRKHVDVRLNSHLAGLHMHKTKLVLNRPVYVGMSILDLSKHLMYDFYYNELKQGYGSKCDFMCADTDSLLLEVQSEDIYADIAARTHWYDTSDYPKDHPLHSMAIKKVVGKMKDECAGVPIAEYVGLRPKMYSIKRADNKNTRKAKGVEKCVVKKELRHEQYKDVLFTNKTLKHGMNMLRSVRHQIFGLRANKVSLSPFDSKRWIARNGIDTLAYGHKDIRPQAAPHERILA